MNFPRTIATHNTASYFRLPSEFTTPSFRLTLLQPGLFAKLLDRREPNRLGHGRHKMNRSTESRSIHRPMAIVLPLLLGVAFGLFAFRTLTPSGTASLPNGTTAVINGPFSCSDIPPTTNIEAGGHTFTFSPTTISVDGMPVGPLDASVTSVEIDANYWSASLRVNGDEVTTFR